MESFIQNFDWTPYRREKFFSGHTRTLNMVLWVRRCFLVLLIITFLVSNGFTQKKSEVEENLLSKIRLPEGFRIDVFAQQILDARQITLGKGRVLYAGTRKRGVVYRIEDRDGDWKADRVQIILKGLHMPNGVAYRNGALYIAEVHRILRIVNVDQVPEEKPRVEIVYDKLPDKRHHGWKYIKFGPDGWLYIPVGVPCNICEPDPGSLFGTITRLNVETGELDIVARGVRNSVGFDWAPDTNELWFTDNGRDWLGDDQPPDELNRVRKFGLHFGYPYCHGTSLPDPEYGKGHSCSEFEPPAKELGPHVASLGMIFYRGKQFPKEYRGGIFIAEHGSWNRKVPIGYRVMFLKREKNRILSYEPFAEGWLQGRKKWGRPVDILELPDGSILVSDDFGGRIYRITREGGGT